MNRTGRPRGTWLRRLSAAGLVLALLTLAACRHGEGKAALPGSVTGEGAQALGSSIDRDVLEYLKQEEVPGATVAITRAGRLVWAKGYGYAQLAVKDGKTARQARIMRPWYRSRIGSTSKILTAIAAMQLVQAGDLKLDDPIYGDPGPFTPGKEWPVDSAELRAAVLDNPAQYWKAMRDGVDAGNHAGELNEMIGWGKDITLEHLLSHQSGILGGGDAPRAEAHFSKQQYSPHPGTTLSYEDLHRATMLGLREVGENNPVLKCLGDGSLYVHKKDPAYTGKMYSLPPLGRAPNTEWCYSNHAFGLLGEIINQANGNRGTYATAITQKVLRPLGLTNVVGNNTDLGDEIDAWPHGYELDPDTPSMLGRATGGWSASAKDLARIMCGLDTGSNNLRLLNPKVAARMAVPDNLGAPLGWDSLKGARLSKNGMTGGGSSLIMKFLPGEFAQAPKDEINVAIALNAGQNWPRATERPDLPSDLLPKIAKRVAAAQIPADYDLFDPKYRCVKEGLEVEITAPKNGSSVHYGDEIGFEARAHDSNGDSLPITWTIPHKAKPVVTKGLGGKHAVFYDKLPPGKHTIVATATDVGGQTATDKVTVEVRYDPPQVAILSPKDKATVWAGEPLELSGQSKSRYHTLPDSAVSWKIERADDSRIGIGHSLVVPGAQMQPGSYRITFTGNDGVAQASRSIEVTAEPKPPSYPTATIVKPARDSRHHTTADIAFAGSAVDGNGEAIDGTHFRWTATRAGEEKVLCEGSRIPDPGSGGELTAAQDCSTFTARLDSPHMGADTIYAITLQVWNTDGEMDVQQTSIAVRTPPEG